MCWKWKLHIKQSLCKNNFWNQKSSFLVPLLNLVKDMWDKSLSIKHSSKYFQHIKCGVSCTIKPPLKWNKTSRAHHVRCDMEIKSSFKVGSQDTIYYYETEGKALGNDVNMALFERVKSPFLFLIFLNKFLKYKIFFQI